MVEMSQTESGSESAILLTPSLCFEIVTVVPPSSAAPPDPLERSGVRSLGNGVIVVGSPLDMMNLAKWLESCLRRQKRVLEIEHKSRD